MSAPLTGLQRIRLDTLVGQLKERRMHTKAADLRQALALLDTQTQVIERLQAGWLPQRRADGEPSWRMNGYYPPKWLPMTPGEVAIVFGESDR